MVEAPSPKIEIQSAWPAIEEYVTARSCDFIMSVLRDVSSIQTARCKKGYSSVEHHFYIALGRVRASKKATFARVTTSLKPASIDVSVADAVNPRTPESDTFKAFQGRHELSGVHKQR